MSAGWKLEQCYSLILGRHCRCAEGVAHVVHLHDHRSRVVEESLVHLCDGMEENLSETLAPPGRTSLHGSHSSQLAF